MEQVPLESDRHLIKDFFLSWNEQLKNKRTDPEHTVKYSFSYRPQTDAYFRGEDPN